jgi:hypothetical protein
LLVASGDRRLILIKARTACQSSLRRSFDGERGGRQEANGGGCRGTRFAVLPMLVAEFARNSRAYRKPLKKKVKQLPVSVWTGEPWRLFLHIG